MYVWRMALTIFPNWEFRECRYQSLDNSYQMPYEMKESPLRLKSYQLALRIVRLSKYLAVEKREFVLSRQVLRSGTNPGAMVREAQNAESKKDFIHKLKIAQKETSETMYWLELLKDSKYIEDSEFSELHSLSKEVIKMIVSTVKTTSKSL